MPLSSATRRRLNEQYLLPTDQVDVQGESYTDILRIIPTNDRARLAFDDLATKKLENSLSPHHAQFIVVNEKKLLVSNTVHPRPDDETADEEDLTEPMVDKILYHGYFRIDFDCPALRNDIKYAVGRGSAMRFGPNRNVDILLAAPGSEYSHGLQATQALLRLHPTSGAWLLYAGVISRHLAMERHASLLATSANISSAVPVLGKKPSQEPSSSNATLFILDNTPFSEGEVCPLTLPSSTLRINGMIYEITFMIKSPKQENLYRKKRDEILENAGMPIPNTVISGIPFEVDQMSKTAIFRHGLGSGAFGNVFEGFDRKTGDLRVVKKITINSKSARSVVDNELKASRHFSASEGIVTLFECFNSAGGTGTDEETYPLEVCMVQERGIAFSKYRWAEGPVNWKLRAVLLRQLLRGLQAIHDRGCMHRDITPMNLLYFEEEHKHAGLCDFGKLCWTTTETETALAAWRWLPPEIKKVDGKAERVTYNQKIDIWMLSLSVLHVWYPRIFEDLAPRNLQQHAEIVRRLRNEITLSVAPLLSQMFSWDQAERPSAREALDHECWKDPFLDNADTSKVSNAKRYKHD